MNDIAEIDARFGDGSGRSITPQRPAGQATMVEQARAIAEVRAAVMIAMDRPRDRTAAIAEMREVCGIQALAERAFFRVPRGREHVNGESIHLARELARCWGNIDYGVKELARDDIRGQSELLAFAWDLQTNARSEITFIVPHVRGRNNNRLTGTQEIYENNASFAGRRLREAIFAVLPVWFKAEAAEICHETLEKGGGKPLIQRIADLRTAFTDIGVTVEQLQQKRGRKIDDFLPEDVAALRVVYGSIKRGEVTIAEEFPAPETARSAPAAGSKLDALEDATVVDEQGPADDSGDIPFATGPAASTGEPGRTPDIATDDAPGGFTAAQADRDEAWWSRERLTIDWRDQRAGQLELNRRLREARTEFEVQAIRDDNGEMIDALPKATRVDVLSALMDREKAMRQQEASAA